LYPKKPESPLDQPTTRTFKETEVIDLCTSEEASEEENDDVKSLLLVSDTEVCLMMVVANSV
jgi:hypothetical protein